MMNHRLSFGKILDLRMYMEGIEMQVAPVERIVFDVLYRDGVRLDERVNRGRWDQLILNPKQVLFGVMDSLVCFQIGEALRVRKISKSDIKVKSDFELRMEAGVPELEDLYGYYV
ncbi:unnamed protein product [Linum tenue]|uniref:Uncharacterized protein n=1 Tax=Linum tenue TaxID=586396 RepID=A0AAV0NWM8_9ROSI|nr:unnamed protein product [Linum tenue]